MTTSTETADPALDLYGFWQSHAADGWLMSEWPAGQSSILQWSPDNVRVAADGSVELVLDRAPAGSEYPYQAGEVQSAETATTGTWGWTVQAPEMTPGAVFGLFTYKADWENQPWVEFDFEFVGADTTRVQLNIHMLNDAGEHVTLDNHGFKPVFIDLGFDASESVHTYEITVTEEKAIFYIDGEVVGEFTGADMPGGVWNIGPMKSYINLWAVQPEQELWAGVWADPAEPLVARIMGAEVRAGEYASNYGTDPEAPTDIPTDPADPDPASWEEVDSAGTITVFSEHSYVLPDRVTNLVLTGSADTDGTGNALNNRLTGNIGNNLLDGGLGADTVEGGGGNDTYIVDILGDVVIEAADGGSDTVYASFSFALPNHVEDVVLTGTAHLNAIGNVLNNRLTGNAGNNILNGGLGADIMEGDAGNDLYIVENVGDVVIEGTGLGTDTVRTSLATHTLANNVENLTYIGTTAPTTAFNWTGNVAANTIITGNGADTLSGLGGNDILNSGGGNDTVIGGDGNDTMTGGAGNDVFNGGAGTDRAVFSGTVATYGFALSGTSIVVTALTGTDGTDTLSTVEELSFGGSVLTLRQGTTASQTLNGVNIAADLMLGFSGDDTLNGLSGNDVLIGEAGNDVLTGGAGRDILSGGAGADRFVFALETETGLGISARDVIRDFEVNVVGELIDLSVIDASSITAANNAFTFLGTAAFTLANDNGGLRYFQQNGNTIIQGSTDDDIAPEFEIELTGLHTLTANDFVL